VYAKAEVMADEISATMRAAFSAAAAIAAGEMGASEAAEAAGVFPETRAMVVTQSRVMVVVYTMLLRAFLQERMGESRYARRSFSCYTASYRPCRKV
jgi:hypothetical protein